MSLAEAIVIVNDYQCWRRGLAPYEYKEAASKCPEYSAKQYGEAIDVLLEACRKISP